MLRIVQSIYDTGTKPDIFTRTEPSKISVALFGAMQHFHH
jgi:hypothetical protein